MEHGRKWWVSGPAAGPSCPLPARFGNAARETPRCTVQLTGFAPARPGAARPRLAIKEQKEKREPAALAAFHARQRGVHSGIACQAWT